MVFPVVGLLFGAGQLTSAVVLAAGSNGGATSTYATEGEQCVTLPLVDQSNAASDPTAGASTGPCGEGSTTMTLGLVAAGIAIAPLLAVWSVLQGALSAAGAIGGKMAGVVSKFGDSRKKGRMDDIAKRRERISNERQANALNNKWSGANITSFGSNRRAARRNARGKQASTGLEAAEAGFNLSDDKASAFTQQAAVNKAAASAANIANNASLGQNISANNGGDILNALGKENQGNAAVNSAIAAQVSRATAEAVKDAELNLSGESVENLGVKLEAAIKEGKTIEAQAAQNKLFSSGSSGLKEYRSRMTGLTEPGGGANASTLQSVNNNLAMNHGAIKSTAADLMSHATSPAGTSLSSVSGNSSTWNMSDADLVGQKDHSIGLAVSAGGISVEQAQRILSNPQLAKELNDKSRTVLSSINGPYRPTAP